MNTPPVPAFRALTLEDHDLQWAIGSQVLRNCGATDVLEAPDGATALAYVRSAAPPVDVLICDLKMPGMDGLEFLRHIAELGCASSVILASALDSSIIRAAEIMAQTYGIRIVGVIDKHLSRNKLKTVAEGIETAEDWDVIARLGCECAQGCFIAKPMAGEHLMEWHANWLSVSRVRTSDEPAARAKT